MTSRLTRQSLTWTQDGEKVEEGLHKVLSIGRVG
jgi:hypothetical protein